MWRARSQILMAIFETLAYPNFGTKSEKYLPARSVTADRRLEDQEQTFATSFLVYVKIGDDNFI